MYYIYSHILHIISYVYDILNMICTHIHLLKRNIDILIYIYIYTYTYAYEYDFRIIPRCCQSRIAQIVAHRSERLGTWFTGILHVCIYIYMHIYIFTHWFTYSGLLIACFSLVSLVSICGRVHHQWAVLKLTECSGVHHIEEEGWPKPLEMSQKTEATEDFLNWFGSSFVRNPANPSFRPWEFLARIMVGMLPWQIADMMTQHVYVCAACIYTYIDIYTCVCIRIDKIIDVCLICCDHTWVKNAVWIMTSATTVSPKGPDFQWC